MRWNMEYEWHNFCAPRAEGSVSLYNKVIVGSMPVIMDAYFCTHICAMANLRGNHKTSCWLAAQLFGQQTDIVHRLRRDKRVFILAIAAVQSALPLHILVVFSDKSGQSTVGLRGLERRGSAGKLGERKRLVVIWVERQRNADDEVGSLFVWVRSVELQLMLFGQFSSYKPVLWS